MGKLQRKRVDQPDEVRTYSGGSIEVFEMDDFVIGRLVMQPGWRWSVNVQPIAGTERCAYHHLGYTISGRAGIRMTDGSEIEIGPNDIYEIPPGHDAWVIGDEPWVSIDFRGARAFARPTIGSGTRVLATVLFTDIVDSTSLLQRIGDAAWRDTMASYDELVQLELDHFHGREVKRTGDGTMAIFDGPARAVECAAALARRVRGAGVEIRSGVHTGEVELVRDDVRGVAVHFAARVMSLASPGEVLISSVVHELLTGAGLRFEPRGRHALKGIDGEREVFALVH